MFVRQTKFGISSCITNYSSGSSVQPRRTRDFLFYEGGKIFLILTIVVDDTVFPFSDQKLSNHFKSQLVSTFNVKFLGKLTKLIV